MERRESALQSLVAKTLGSLQRRYSEEDETRRLERYLAIENAQPPKSKISRVRQKGGLLLHSKQILLAVVLLNLVDCALVLGELILDIHYIRGLVETMDEDSQMFIDKMEQKYPNSLQNNDIDHINHLFEQVIEANCTFSNSHGGYLDTTTESSPNTFRGIPIVSTTEAENFRLRRLLQEPPASDDVTGNLAENETKDSGHTVKHMPHAHSVWEDVAHGLHKASITILGILFVENVMKVLFMGRRFLANKLEVFDFFIVTISFVLDLVFLKGLTVYRIQDGILILSFLVPWRVIRVVNSLIVAVLDHEHFRLKMMYKKQKTVSAELKEVKDLAKELQLHLKKIERFCLTEGIPQWKVSQHIHFRKSASTISSMASYAFGSMLSGLLGDSPLMKKKSETIVNVDKYTSVNSLNSTDTHKRHDSGRGSSIIEDPESSGSRSDDETISRKSNVTEDGQYESPRNGVEKGNSMSAPSDLEKRGSISAPSDVEKEESMTAPSDVEKGKTTIAPSNVEKRETTSAPPDVEKGESASAHFSDSDGGDDPLSSTRL